jgi:hypothetical protein
MLAAARAAGALALLGLLATGCKVVEAKAYNLDQLHNDEGGHKPVAALMGNVEFAIRYGFFGILKGAGAQVREKTPTKVKDPLGECVDNLLELAEFDPENLGVSARQVEFFARLANTDPWKLSREICVRELGRAGQRLALDTVPVKITEGTLAREEDVAEALRKLIGSMTAEDRGKGLRVVTGTEKLPEACAAVASLHLDLAGALRALRTTAILEGSAGAKDPRLQPLRDLNLELQRRCVRQALAAALDDRDPLVRAAAVESEVRVWGAPKLAVHFERLRSAKSDPEVALRVVELVQRMGLPPPTPGSSEADAAREQELRLLLLYSVATLEADERLERLRIAAMGALSAVSGAGMKSLREEAWQDWWLARHPRAPGAAPTPASAPPGTASPEPPESVGEPSKTAGRAP